MTPYPQNGNPKPRVFRIPSQQALINRYGLNSEGADHVAMRLRQRVREYAHTNGFGIDEEAEQRVLDGEAGVPSGSLMKGKLMAVQVAKNKFTSDDDIEAVKEDYVYCVKALARYADIIVVNVSSPNTPGLRGLQKVEPLTNILTGVVEAAKQANRKTKPAVMVKISPDEDSDDQVSGICEAIFDSGVDGVIVGNTTKRRPDVLPIGYNISEKEAAIMLEQGGFSGPHIFERTVNLVKKYRIRLDQGPQRKSVPSQQNSPQEGQDDNPSSAPTTTESSPPEPKEESTLSSQISATVTRDLPNVKPQTQAAEESSNSRPLLRLPERNNPFTDTPPQSDPSRTLSSSTHPDQLPRAPSTSNSTSSSPFQPKVIFATGGITNGAQALEVLNAGASLAMVYTTLVYNGVGTITRIKDEMRQEMRKQRPVDKDEL